MRLLKIGRDASCNIVMHSDKVSSLHAEITLLNSGDILLEDKGSRNGTFVMNQAIKPNKPVKINRGDLVRFADVELQWSQVPMPEDNSAYRAIYGIGSHFNNDIQISGATVSRYHATIKHGRDGKWYIVDHSKNGTTVDGVKIPTNNPYRIKRKSAIVCGGVPTDLSSIIPPPIPIWKHIVVIVASVFILFGIGFGVNNSAFVNSCESDGGDPWPPTKIYERYNSSVVMLVGVFHYEVTAGSLDLERLGLPTKFLFIDGSPVDITNIPESVWHRYGTYTGTGFFISEDGQIITNLHVIKPWLFDNTLQQFEDYYREKFAKIADVTGTYGTLVSGESAGLSAYISQIKVVGVSDGVLLIPQGRFFSSENAIKCTVLSAGEDINKDVSLIQSDKMELPNKKCTFVNVADSMDVSSDALKVGKNMFTIGFPHGLSLQDLENEKGIQVFCHAGRITRESEEYGFNFDAVSAGGASGSPIFNDYGMLIGVLNQGVKNENINMGIKAQYVKELIEQPHKK